MRRPHSFLAIVLCCLTLFCGHAAAQDLVVQTDAGIDQRAATLVEIRTELDAPKANYLKLREELREIRRQAVSQTEPIREQLALRRTDLERLGPAPEEGGIQEDTEIADERAKLVREIAKLDSAVKRSDLNIAEADRLMETISVKRREAFSSEIFQRSQSALSPKIWGPATQTLTQGFTAARLSAERWLQSKEEKGETTTLYLVLAAGIIFALASFFPLRQRMDNAVNNRIAKMEPKASRRVMVAAARGLSRFLPALLGGFVLYEVFRFQGAIPKSAEPFAYTLWLSLVALFLWDGVLTGTFAPRLPQWRIISIENSAAFRVRALVVSSVAIIGLQLSALQGAELFAHSPGLSLAVKSLSTLFLALILLALCQPALWRAPETETSTEDESDAANTSDETQSTGNKNWLKIRLLGRALAIVSIFAILFGYIAFGNFVITRVFYLAGLASFIWLIRSLLREGVRLFDERFTKPAEVDTGDESVLYYWIGVTVDIIAFLIFLPPAALVLGADWADVRNGISDAFFGFSVGGIRISIAKVLLAIAFAILALQATRLVQKTAETKLFPKSRIDVGVQNSLKTLIGYIGLVVAFMVGVSMLGFNLSNLAIIAGALSVGIGFGLQSIVNNFVSGLILLFERPIKVGDWVVASSGEGIVKRISVRSTEIETFDRSSIIIPNSELISGAVTNWTHKDKLGRVIVGVGVSYDSDPEQVIELLNEVAKEDSNILSYPAPFVNFADFADSSLNFELRGFVRDVGTSLSARRQLRIAIFKKFRDAGIEIPFPQRDINIKGSPMPAESMTSSE